MTFAERTDLSSEMALQIEKAFGPKMDHLMRMQLVFDLAKQREWEQTIKVKRYCRMVHACLPDS